MLLTPHRAVLCSLALAAASVMSGCIVAPARGYGYGHGGPGVGVGVQVGGPVVTVEPPTPQYEVVGAPPVVGQIWIGGFWNWVGNRHVWVPGRWEAHRPGHQWVPHAWHREGPGWRFAPGRWERR